MTSDLVSASDARAKETKHLSARETTAAEAGRKLALYIGRILGTTAEDAEGLAIDDPLRLVRMEIASQYDELLTRLLARRGVDPQPVAPAIAIPLLRAAYDESRAELQELWAGLIAAAMDPARAGAVRQSFITAIRQLDPLDARLLVWMCGYNGPDIINLPDKACKDLNASPDEIRISFMNLERAGCIHHDAQRSQRPVVGPFGRQLLSACCD